MSSPNTKLLDREAERRMRADEHPVFAGEKLPDRAHLGRIDPLLVGAGGVA